VKFKKSTKSRSVKNKIKNINSNINQKIMSKMETSIDHLLVDCKNDKIKECLSKLKGTKLDKSLFTKISKETLCDSLIFMARTLFGAATQEEANQSISENANENLSILMPSQEDIILNNKETEENTELEEENTHFEEENKPICTLFLKNRCPSGIKGRNCTNQHPTQCKKFLQGGRSKEGCQNWNCDFLHPQICQNSYIFGNCQKFGCKQRHIKNKMNQTKEPENRSFLWQTQMEAQINKLTEMNKNILQKLTQTQQRLIPVWNLPHQEPISSQQPMWTTNRNL
jgi:hypothetical protein